MCDLAPERINNAAGFLFLPVVRRGNSMKRVYNPCRWENCPYRNQCTGYFPAGRRFKTLHVSHAELATRKKGGKPHIRKNRLRANRASSADGDNRGVLKRRAGEEEENGIQTRTGIDLLNMCSFACGRRKGMTNPESGVFLLRSDNFFRLRSGGHLNISFLPQLFLVRIRQKASSGQWHENAFPSFIRFRHSRTPPLLFFTAADYACAHACFHLPPPSHLLRTSDKLGKPREEKSPKVITVYSCCILKGKRKNRGRLKQTVQIWLWEKESVPRYGCERERSLSKPIP